MLKTSLIGRSFLLAPKRFLSSSISSRVVPSTTQSVILTNIPVTATESVVKESLKDLTARKVELEPGCMLHFLNESSAHLAAQVVGGNFKYKTKILSATMPSLLLKNLPENTTVNMLNDSFSPYNPRSVSISGKATLEATVGSFEAAFKLASVINKIDINGQTLQTSTVKLPNQQYSVRIFNVPAGVTAQEAEQAVQTAVGADASFKPLNLTSTPAIGRSFQLRLSASDGEKIDQITQALRKINISVSTSTELRKPAVIVRNAKHLDEKYRESLFGPHNPERVQTVLDAKNKEKVDSLVAFFVSEQAALACLQAIKSTPVNGRTLNAVYREVAEPAVYLTGLPANVTEQEVRDFCKAFDVGAVSLDAAAGAATVVLSSPREATRAYEALNRRPLREQRVKASVSSLSDVGLVISSTDASLTEETILSVLQAEGVAVKSISQESNVHAFVSFLSTNEALNAQSSLLKGRTRLESADGTASGGGMVVSALSVVPSFALQVQGLPVDTPASTVTDALSAACPDLQVLKADRSALVKMMRQSQVVPGLKKMRQVMIDGQQLSAQPYRPLSNPGSSEYDLPADHDHNVVDQFSLTMLLKDYMFADPAARYQVAKNYFERALANAQGQKEIGHLLEKDATAAQSAEVAQLLKVLEDDTNEENSQSASKRLFEMFLQREDMAKFAGDFREIEAFLGPMNTSDPFDWSQFQVDNAPGLDKLRAEAKRLEAISTQKMLDKLRGKDSSDGPREVVIKGETMEEEDAVISLEDPDQLRDKEGNTWSGIILNTDMVQKVTPGQRVLTHRCLVMIGNLRGAGGYGMGKGKTPADALNSAFRAALRNLVHIDLYENFGLAHDLHGYHNSCHAYIRATPQSRVMVASSFAEEILLRMGISSASCKLVGRRDPYAMVMAIFKGLAQHENIDEFAKDRGKRYITLKWAYENGI